jgi:hypothetical protein
MDALPVAISSGVSFDDALLIAERCFGELGRKTIFLWQRYNEEYFSGSLEVTPVLYVPTSPYGHWIGLHRADRNIYLMPPAPSRPWSRVRAVLLHEMIHQNLSQSGKDVRHAGEPWCREIMRISMHFDRKIWAGKYTVRNGQRVNTAPPLATNARILNQREIASWPHSINIEPPDNA